MDVCKNCSFFNFKVDAGNGAFGECRNPKNQKALRISFAKCDPDIVTVDAKKEINNYAPILLQEDIMGCVNFESR